MPDGKPQVMPAQTRAATFVPASFSAENRTVDLVWSAGAAVPRIDWWSGKRYVETLSMDPAHVDLSRLNSGAPLLVDHRMYETEAVIGVVERAWIENGEGKATVRFSEDVDAQRVAAKVREGVLRNVSITYSVRKYEITEEEGKSPIWLAVDYQPMEISLVPVGADAVAGTRSAPREESYPVEFTTRGQPAPVTQEKRNMEDPNKTTAGQPGATEQSRAAPATAPGGPAPATAPATVDVAAERRAAAEVERKRAADIRLRVRSVQLDETVADDLIARGVDGDAVAAAIVDEIAKRGGKAARPGVSIGYDAADLANVRGALEEALIARAGRHMPTAKFEPTERSRGFINMPVLEMFAELARAHGHKIDRHARGAALWDSLVQLRALSTSDFPLLLANTGNKILVKAYELAGSTYELIGARKLMNDFKPHSFIRGGDFPNLLLKGETGEFKYGSMSEAQNQLTLATYGRVLGISRRMIVNDDLGAFVDLPAKAGRRVADFNNATFWAQLALNSGAGPTIFEKNMPTGRPLFHSDHANYASSGTIIDVTNVGVGRAAMMNQQSLDSLKLNVMPKYLFVSPDKMTQAEQFCAVNIVAAKDSDSNPFKGRLTPVGDANVTGNAWYLFADPAVLETMVYGFLNGAEGPQIRSEEGFKTDGVEMLVYEDFVAGAIDYRGAYKNAGA